MGPVYGKIIPHYPGPMEKSLVFDGLPLQLGRVQKELEITQRLTPHR